MKALMLAAGVGNRLGKASQDRPKCLLQFHEKSLLQRHIEILAKYGIPELTIVVGYRSELIQAEIDKMKANSWVKTIYNADYCQGSVISFAKLREGFNGTEDVLIMDADVLYDDRIIAKLIDTKIANCFLLDRGFEMGEEPVKLCVKNNYLTEFRKQLEPNLEYETIGESVGFFRFSGTMAKKLFDRADSYIQVSKYDAPYEEIIRDLLLTDPTSFGYEDVTGIPWIEIDFPEDIQRAKAKFGVGR
jgi:choline kinase